MNAAIRNCFFPAMMVAMACCDSPETITPDNYSTDMQPVSASDSDDKSLPDYFIQILGNVQDGGSPHAGCTESCCEQLFINPDSSRKVVSLGLVDKPGKKAWLFEATPDISSQMKILKKVSGSKNESPDGIFLTHAHIGHYAGLMYLGREAMNADSVPVYVMSGMQKFLESNGPWDQLINSGNILPVLLREESALDIRPSLKVSPFLVPHRDEYSETVGYKIIGPSKSALFIPDIDKWSKWQNDICTEIASVDYAFIDGTFFGQDELKNRDMSEIPHPFITESMELFSKLGTAERNKVWFIHLNHSNPALNPSSRESAEIEQNGFHVARFGDVFGL